VLGAAIIKTGFGLGYVPLAGAGTALLGLIMVLWFMRSRQQRSDQNPVPAC
jgi:DHA1 family inner membrane transport protein